MNYIQKNNKNLYVGKNIICTIIKCCRGEKKETKENKMNSEKSW